MNNEVDSITNVEEMYMLNKDIFSTMHQEFSHSTEKVYKLLTVFSFTLPFVGFLFNWLMTQFHYLEIPNVIILFLLSCNALILIYFVFLILDKVRICLMQKTTQHVLIKDCDYELLKKLASYEFYDFFVKQYIIANDNNYKLVVDKLEKSEELYRTFIRYIIALASFFLLYIIFNLINYKHG